MNEQIAIVMSEEFLRRITPSLVPFVLERQDFRVLHIDRDFEELASLLQEMQPSGLITEWLPDITEDLINLGFPTVIADTDIQYNDVVSIDVDDWAVGAEAAEAFIQAGFRNFACVGNGTPYSEQRIAGFSERIQQSLGDTLEHPISSYSEPRIRNAGYSEYVVKASTTFIEWLKAVPKPVALFAVHDPIGRLICGVCRELGIEVPNQVAVIGANNDELVCGLTYPMLSSVAIPWNGLGARVGEAMFSMLAGEPLPDEPILLKPSGVILRHSANHLAVPDTELRRAMSYFSENLQNPIGVGQLCDALKLGRRSIERKFRSFFDCTPWEMLCRMRVDHAKKLLVDTNHPISLVAELSGFNDPERMAVVFKRVEKTSPSSWRKRALGG
ncbi:substrate-binding domain-containing protein [Rubritalea marina]|uniref:substrate-binding domain-containing protein n=1 Tax=Rubritalea marina TaxID=361055 RepID=UPI000361ED19|nr:substrate-binding domain-containing protein [Rubritalea marina]